MSENENGDFMGYLRIRIQTPLLNYLQAEAHQVLRMGDLDILQAYMYHRVPMYQMVVFFNSHRVLVYQVVVFFNSHRVLVYQVVVSSTATEC